MSQSSYSSSALAAEFVAACAEATDAGAAHECLRRRERDLQSLSGGPAREALQQLLAAPGALPAARVHLLGVFAEAIAADESGATLARACEVLDASLSDDPAPTTLSLVPHKSE